MELIKIIMGLISYQIKDIKIKLEVESKGNEIAYMQGKLKGLRQYKIAMDEYLEFTGLFEFWKPIKEFDVSTIKNSVLKLLVSQVSASKNNEGWLSILNMVDSEVERMKDYLFLSAENARALFLTHGTRDGLFISKETMSDIISQYDYRVKKEKERKEDEPLLDWMGYNEDPEEVVESVEVFNDLFINMDIEDETVNIAVEHEE